MPDRRTFIKNTGLLAILPVFKAEGQVSISTQPFYTDGTMQLIAFSDYIKGAPNGRAFSNQVNSAQGVKSVWTQSMDNAVKQAAYRVTESDFYPNSKVNALQIYNYYKSYVPGLSLLGVAEAIQALIRAGINTGVLTQVLNQIRTNGMVPYLTMATNLANSYAIQLNKPPVLHLYTPPVPYNNGNSVPTTGENPGCKLDGAALLAVGTALVIITIMTDGLDLLVAAGWEAVAWWGGVGVGGWSIMHAMVCGF